MKQLAGIYFTDYTADFIAERKARGEAVTLCSTEGGRCCNCQSDDGSLIIFVTDGGDHPAQVTFTPRVGHHYRFNCPVCNDDSQARLEFLWQLSGLHSDECDWHIDFVAGLDGKESALATARELLAMTPAPSGWYSLLGSYGVGKTGILKSLVAGFVRAGVEARYVRAEDILTEIRATFDGDTDGGNEFEIIRKYSRIRVLAVDEVGTDRMSSTQWAQAKLMSVFDNRYSLRDHIATILATNETPESLSTVYGYLASRMKDGRRVVMTGCDLRGDRLAAHVGTR